MRLLLDSSFFFPLIGIEISQFSRKAILQLVSKEEIIRSELVIFELSAKGSKLINAGKLTINDLTRGITAIYNHPEILVIPIHHSEIQKFACELQKNHSDFIDCLILASAVNYADILITLDKEIEHKSITNWKEKIKGINENFQLILCKDFSQDHL